MASVAAANGESHGQPRSRPTTDERILIVGAGVFGLSTARQLAARGFSNITVLDRYPPPVPDGSSVDISRIIRPDYADQFYAKLGLEAMAGWKDEYSSYFFQSGLLLVSQDLKHPYVDNSKENVRKLGMNVESVEGNEARACCPAIQGDLSETRGYLNPACGWANAEGSIRYLAAQCTHLGVIFATGDRGTVTALLQENSKVVGVQTKSQTPIYADHVILATGAWSPHVLDVSLVSVSDAQPVGYMQLTLEEAKELQSCPVMVNLSTGWFAFPPTPETNILKMARHGYGYEVMRRLQRDDSQVSAPDVDKDNSASRFIPDEAEAALREGLRLFLPKFQNRDFIRKRLCWYTDTPKGDFIVDYHPNYSNLFIAFGGSGHAFKFLPVLGRCVADAFELQASREQMEKWAWQSNAEPISRGDGSRGGPPRRTLLEHERACL